MMSLFVLVMDVCEDGDHEFNIISTDYCVNVNTTWGTSRTRRPFNSPALLIGQLLDLHLPTWKYRHTKVKMWRNPSTPGVGSFSHLPPLAREPPVVSGEECWSTPWDRTHFNCWNWNTEFKTVSRGSVLSGDGEPFHWANRLIWVEPLTSPEWKQIKTSY